MLLTIPAIMLSAALMLAMLMNLTLKPEKAARINAVCLAIVAAGGFLYYGAGYMEVSGDLLLTVLRTPVFVLRMFAGVNELPAIAGSRLVSSRPGLIGFWLIHMLAFFSTASAALNALAAEAIRQLRFLLSRRGDLTLIYGITEDSVALGKECLAAGGTAVVFLAESALPAQIKDLNYAGMTVMTGLGAVSCDRKTMRRLRIGRRKVTVYALCPAEDKDLCFALRLKAALEQAGVPAERTRVTLPGAEDIIASMLQVSQTEYGFGYVQVFDRNMLAARALIRMCPPWEAVRFGADGRAQEDYSCAIVGFGSLGQAVLRQLVMNGQFAGSRFHAAVFSDDFHREAGYLAADSPELLKNYDIQSFEGDGRSSAFYAYIGRHLQTLKLIVICTGSADEDREVSDHLMLFLKRRGAEQISVVRCSDKGVRFQESVGGPILTANIYSREHLSVVRADRRAILLNASYDDSPRSDWEKWIACDSFSKMSSRASADFMPAFIRASGSSREELCAGRWQPSDALLQNLGETEHMRWNAFHFAMGYSPMSREEFEDNARTWARCREEGRPCSIKIAKNASARRHACLVPWEELDALSAREKALTGRDVDYKQIDINNVLTMPKLLRLEEEKGGEL